MSGRLSALIGSRPVILIGVLGVAVFGSLVAVGSQFTSGLHVALVTSMLLVTAGAAVIAAPVIGGPVMRGLDGAGGRRPARPRLRSAFDRWSR